MAPKPKTITAKALQTLLTRIGSASSGIKATLHERFQRDIQIPRLPTRSSNLDSNASKKSLRIMSIDMGIKNLAFCESIVSYPKKGSLNTNMKIMRWEKINLVPATNPPSKDTEEDEGPYSLSVLSKTAYRLIKDTILTAKPDIILIEKQRWRSGGGSAIQQWTVRVNTFEGMLWAILRTLLMESNDEEHYEVFGVDPKRVGNYWLAQPNVELIGSKGEDGISKLKKPSRTKLEKKAKIALLRSWLTATPASTTPPSMSFTFDTQASQTLQALISPNHAKKKPPIKALADAIPESELRKLDDITDCFLQAAAWVSWEANRVQLKDVWDRRRGADVELSNKVLLEMVGDV
jgi:cruciform cutting endonuclease 1